MEEVNVEEIMKEIKEDIERKGLKEENLNFEFARTAIIKDELALMHRGLSDSLYNANKYAIINPEFEITGNFFARLIKKFIRKCVLFYIGDLVGKQNEFNFYVVKTLNDMEKYIDHFEKKEINE